MTFIYLQTIHLQSVPWNMDLIEQGGKQPKYLLERIILLQLRVFRTDWNLMISEQKDTKAFPSRELALFRDIPGNSLNRYILLAVAFLQTWFWMPLINWRGPKREPIPHKSSSTPEDMQLRAPW